MFTIIKENLQGKKVFWFFAITQVVYFTMILVTIPKVAGFADNLKIFDIRQFGYTYQEAIELLNNLGAEGRNIYLYRQIPLDLIYPGLFGISFCLILAFFLNKLNLLNTKLIYLTILPLISGGFDYLENFSIIAMLRSFPEVSQNLVIFASNFTIIKSILTTLYFLVLIFVLLKLGYKKILHKSN
ncbi:hypothetical protein [Flavobacterium sp. H122]|uniref:hypothetical protein n=1 Tax=Flavobacterium sp. H122 TaxID=2529860 RepID=UPI0010AA7073|nr:hypothetical protein [Flavobacterium sp. H122]